MNSRKEVERNMQLEPTSRWLSEQGHLTSRVRIHLADALILLAKEVEGYPPVLAIDFEVLHGYLFPTIQSVNSRILPSCASYVIHNFPNRFVLPPGTALELLRYTEKYYRVLEELNSILHGSDLDSSSRDHMVEIRNLYQQVAPASDVRFAGGSMESDIAVAANALSEVAVGFKRLSWFVSEKVAPLDSFAEGWNGLYDSNSELVSALAARLSGVQSLRSTRSRTSNENDARNIAAILCIHRLQREDSARGKDLCSMQLLTETRPVLHLNLDDYGRDVVATDLIRKGRLNPEHFSHCRFPWVVTTLNSALVYCALRNAYGSPRAAYREAKKQYVDLAELTVTVLKADAALSERFDQHDPGEVRNDVAQLFGAKGAARWYMPLRTTLTQGAVELESRLKMGIHGHWSTSRQDRSVGMVEVDLHQDHALSKFVVHPSRPSGEPPTADFFSIFGVHMDEARKGELFPLVEWTASCQLTGEQLIGIRRCRNHDIVTVQWQPSVDVDKLLMLLSDMITELGDVQGEVSAFYEYTPEERVASARAETDMAETCNGSSRRQLLLTLPSKKRLSPTRCIKTGHRVGLSMVFPSFIGLECEIGDLLIGLPFQSSPHGPQAVCTVKSHTGVSRLLASLLKSTHAWRWLPSLLDRFIDQVGMYLNISGEGWGDFNAVQ